MSLVSIYAPNAEDFSTNGLGPMLPTECTIEEIKNGKFELTMVQPITDDYRWAQVQIDCILKAAAPVRESPLYELSASSVDATTPTTITRKVYTVKTNGGRLHLRQKPSTSSKILGKYKVGTKFLNRQKYSNFISSAVDYFSVFYLPLQAFFASDSAGK